MTEPLPEATSRHDVLVFFAAQEKTVLTFLGYSGAGYQDPDSMRAAADQVLARFDPLSTIVNIGAIIDGIGVAYDLAKARGFVTTGIVSTKAIAAKAEISPSVDHVFFIEDKTWGGYQDDGKTLSPTSDLMVAVSDVMVAIGGNDVCRDEFLAGRKLGKSVEFIAADMNHKTAGEKAGLKEPVDFGGTLAAFLSAER